MEINTQTLDKALSFFSGSRRAFDYNRMHDPSYFGNGMLSRKIEGQFLHECDTNGDNEVSVKELSEGLKKAYDKLTDGEKNTVYSGVKISEFFSDFSTKYTSGRECYSLFSLKLVPAKKGEKDTYEYTMEDPTAIEWDCNKNVA